MHIPGQLTPRDSLFHSSVHNNNQRLNLPAGLSSLGSQRVSDGLSKPVNIAGKIVPPWGKRVS